MTAGGAPAARVALLGAGGRVGKLLLRASEVLGGPGFCLVQSRRAATGVTDRVDPLAAPAEADALVSALSREAPDLIAVLWGATGDAAVEGRDDNVLLAEAAVDLAANAGCRRVAVMSSMAVYGAVRDAGEDSRCHPASAYGAAKLRMEAALRDSAARRGQTAPEVVVLRLANVCGADMLAGSVARASTAAPLVLDRFGDGQGPRRSYLSPISLCRLLRQLAAAPPGSLPACLNVADGRGAVAMDALLRACADAGRPVPWAWRPAPAHALAEVSMDTRLLRRLWPAERLPLRHGAAALARDWLSLGRTAG